MIHRCPGLHLVLSLVIPPTCLPRLHPGIQASNLLSVYHFVHPFPHYPRHPPSLLLISSPITYPLIHPCNHFLISSHIPPPPPTRSLIQRPHPFIPSSLPSFRDLLIHQFPVHLTTHLFSVNSSTLPSIPSPSHYPLSICPSIYSLILPFPVHSSIHLSSVRPFTPRSLTYSTANLHDEETLTFSLKYSGSVPS